MNEVKVKYHAPIDPLVSIDRGDWIDLRSAKKYNLKAGDYCQLSLGVSVVLPPNCEAIVAGRSSLFRRHGVIPATGIGIIDNSFCGENDVWAFPLYATRDTTIDFNERVAQFRILKNQEKVSFVTVESTGVEIDRGGVGSTGRF